MTTMLDPFDSTTWDSIERQYFQAIDEALESRADKLLSNGKPAHAAYLIHKFLSHADQVVRIFSGRLLRDHNGSEVYSAGPILEAAAALLRKPNTKFTVLLEKDLDVNYGESVDTHPLIKRISNLSRSDQLEGEFEVRRISSASLRRLAERNVLNHWAVMDDNAFRLELDAEKVEAVANFGAPKLASALIHIFDKILYPDSEQLFSAHA